MLTIPGKSIYLSEFSLRELNDPKYFEWLRDYSVVRNLYRVEYLKPIAFSEVEAYVKRVLASPNDCMFAIYVRDKDDFIGTVKIGHIDWRSGVGDLGIMIGSRQSRGKGYAKEAVKIAADYAFTWIGLRKLSGGTFSDNYAMIRCFEDAGFRLEGVRRKELLVDGEYIDHHLFGLLREEYLAKKAQA